MEGNSAELTLLEKCQNDIPCGLMVKASASRGGGVGGWLGQGRGGGLGEGRGRVPMTTK